MEKMKLDHGGLKQLAKDFRVSVQTANSALQGKTKSQLANLLRTAARERGAYILVKPNKNN